MFREGLGGSTFSWRKKPELKYQAPERELESISEIEKKLEDPKYLPTRAEVKRFFYKNDEKIAHYLFNEKRVVYELFTKEYITALANKIAERAKTYGASKENPLTILEVGAGNGRLSHFLRESFGDALNESVNIVATDSGDWNIESDFPVENIDHAKAIDKYKPAIVVMSWMPPGVDLSSEFRKEPSVKEYILIGEPEGGSCGDIWKTWGAQYEIGKALEAGVVSENDISELRKMDYYGNNNVVRPYQADGFIQEDMDLSNLQICCVDSYDNIKDESSHSRTISFRRDNKQEPLSGDLKQKFDKFMKKMELFKFFNADKEERITKVYKMNISDKKRYAMINAIQSEPFSEEISLKLMHEHKMN